MAEMVNATLNGLWKIKLPKHRADRPDWYTDHGWERKRLEALHQEIKRQKLNKVDPVVYYVGAEEGEMPALCQMWGARVVMFEPNPLVLPNVKAIWDANKLKMPYALFVGFASSSTELDPPHPNKLAVGFIKEWPECAYGPVIGNHGFKELYLESDAFPQTKMDDLLDRLDPPTIITFDCEGSEWEAMKGAEHILKTYKPAIFASISPEFMFHQFGQYSRDFRNWMIGFGYNETLLAYDHELHTMYTPIEEKL